MTTPNTPLLEAIAQAATAKEAEAWYRLYHRLLEATLLVALDESGQKRLRADPASKDKASLLRLGNSQGEAAVIAFTDVESLHRWRRSGPVLSISPRQLFGKLLEIDVQYLVLNIAGPIDVVISRKVFGSLAAGVIPIASPGERIELPPGTTSYLREPKHQRAGEVASALKTSAEGNMAVDTLYLVEKLEGDNVFTLLAAIRFASGISQVLKREAMDQLGAVARHYLPSNESLLIRELDRSLADRFVPIYRRRPISNESF